MVFSFASCIEDESPKEIKLCEKCNRNEGTISTMGTIFDDNNSHLVCESCWDSYRTDHNIKDGGKFD